MDTPTLQRWAALPARNCAHTLEALRSQHPRALMELADTAEQSQWGLPRPAYICVSFMRFYAQAELALDAAARERDGLRMKCGKLEKRLKELEEKSDGR